jgi:thiamine-phosphate pyrophosphorylase
MSRPPRPLDLSVYLITDPLLCAGRGIVDTALAAVAGGATLVQLRDKQAPDAELIALGRALKAALAGCDVPLIINDRIGVAAAIGADGVHVGQGDDSVIEARRVLGPDSIVGLSIQSAAHAAAASALPVDYVGIGPIFATGTKPDHAPPLGFAGLAAVRAATGLPAVAIGGLGVGQVPGVLDAGCDGLAIVSAICAAPDPESATRAFRQAILDHRGEPKP